MLISFVFMNFEGACQGEIIGDLSKSDFIRGIAANRLETRVHSVTELVVAR